MRLTAKRRRVAALQTRHDSSNALHCAGCSSHFNLPQSNKLVLLFVLTGLLLLCGAGFVTGAAAREEVQFWSAFSGGQPKTAIDKFVAEFNAAHAELGRVVKLDVPSSQLEQKLLTAVAGNVPPDLCLFNRPMVAAFAFRGAFESWDKHLSALGLSRNDFFESCWDEGLWDGRQYCIPFNTDVRVMFINRRLFRLAGLDPDSAPRTWDELREVSRKLTVRDAAGRLRQTGFVPVGGAFGNTYLPLFAFQMGDDLVDPAGRIRVNSPRCVAATQWTLDFARDYGVDQLMLLQTAGGNDELALFLQEKAAITGDEGYMLSLIRRYKPGLDFSVAPLPWPADGRPATWSGGFGLILPRGRELTPLAAAFARFLCSREIQLEYGKIADQIPARKDAAADSYFTADPNWRVFIGQMAYTRSLPVSPLSMKMFYDLIRAQEKTLYGAMTPKAALDWTQDQLDQEWTTLTAYDNRREWSWRGMAWTAMAALCAAAVWRLGRSWRAVRGMKLKRAEAFWGYVMALPAIVGLLGLALGPMLISLMISMCKYDVLSPARWLGIDNYRKLFTGDPLFFLSLWNTLAYTLMAVPTGVIVSLSLALLLNQRSWLRPFWRTVFYMPSIFPIVAGSFLWLWLFNGEYGLINMLLGLVGLERVPWLTSPLWSKPALIIMSLWGVGGGMIIFLAALQTVPAHLYEAAMIDGVNFWQRFRHITLPLISPVVLFVTVIATIGSFQVFTQAYLMTAGGPVDSTLFYVLYLFRRAFQEFHMGYAAAMAWTLFVIIGALTFLQFRLSRGMVNYDTV